MAVSLDEGDIEKLGDAAREKIAAESDKSENKNEQRGINASEFEDAENEKRKRPGIGSFQKHGEHKSPAMRSGGYDAEKNKPVYDYDNRRPGIRDRFKEIIKEQRAKRNDPEILKKKADLAEQRLRITKANKARLDTLTGGGASEKFSKRKNMMNSRGKASSPRVGGANPIVETPGFNSNFILGGGSPGYGGVAQAPGPSLDFGFVLGNGPQQPAKKAGQQNQNNVFNPFFFLDQPKPHETKPEHKSSKPKKSKGEDIHIHIHR